MHGAVASSELGEHIVDAVFADWRSAPVPDTTRAALGLIEQLAHTPDEVSPADIAMVRAAGVRDTAIEDALAVTTMFHVINRLNDSFGVQAQDAAGWEAGTRMVNAAYLFKRLNRAGNEESLERMRARVVEGPGHLDQAVRRAAFEGGRVPDETSTYVRKVIENAYKVTDEDVTLLSEAGYSEDHVYELTVATSLGAAMHRWNIGHQIIGGGTQD